ncbi:hypothetical protein V9L05_17520 [Bernardetia sp. Wsw4-3y2]|uniref:hypothetical protein n=1 Tax=Bernardetia sp. Wsw4-3y2 TaxID=3127471 RepID=UPI0030CFFE46
MNNKRRYTASVKAAFKITYFPKLILNNRETIKYFQFIDNFLYSDNKTQFDFNDLIDNTVILFSILSLPNKKIIFAELEKIVLGYEAEKEHAVEYDKGAFIDKTPKKIGSHTIQSEHKKVDKEQTSLKLRFIQKYKEWLSNNKIDLLKENSQSIQESEDNRTRVLIEEQTDNTNDIKQKVSTNPTIKQANTLFEILKDYFEKSQHEELGKLLSTGENVTTKLVFKSNANKLMNTFKQLKENELIIVESKKQLEQWLINNFKFIKQSKPSDLIKDTVHTSISTNKQPCKNPIIQVKNGSILKVIRES